MRLAWRAYFLGIGRVARVALGKYARSPWAALDAGLLVAIFGFCFGGDFDATYFFTSAALPMALLSAVTAYTLTHAVVPRGETLALAKREGCVATVAGLAAAASAARGTCCLLLTLLALLLGRFREPHAAPLVAGVLGLALEGALVAVAVVALSTPGAPRRAPLGALGLLVLGLAAYDTPGTLGASIWLARLPLLPFASAYALGMGAIPLAAWLGVIILAPLTIAGLVWLAAWWLAREFASVSEWP